MHEALLEIVKPEIDAKVNETNKIWEDKTRKSILRTVVRYRKNGTSDMEIKEMLIEDFDLSVKEAERYMSDSDNEIIG